MKTHTSKRTIWSKGLLLLPLLAILLFSFSTTEVIEKEVAYQKTSEFETPLYKNSIIQDIATKQMVKEYNELAKRFNSLPKDKRNISRNELERMVYIFDRMSKKQRDSSEKFPEIIVHKNAPAPPMPVPAEDIHGIVPPPPPPTAAPEARQMEIEMERNSELMPPPPPPVPTEHMKELAAKGAVFYYEGKEISGKEAIRITKELKSINIQVREINSEKPIVKLSKDPIVVD